MQANRQTALALQLTAPNCTATYEQHRLAMNTGVRIMSSHQVLAIARANESLCKLLNACINQNSFSYKEGGIMHTNMI